MADKMTPNLNMDSYKPDAKAINQALWGQDTPPDEDDLKEARERIQKDLEKLRQAEQQRKSE